MHRSKRQIRDRVTRRLVKREKRLSKVQVALERVQRRYQGEEDDDQANGGEGDANDGDDGDKRGDGDNPLRLADENYNHYSAEIPMVAYYSAVREAAKDGSAEGAHVGAAEDDATCKNNSEQRM